MAIAKQPTPTAIRMMSNIFVLLEMARSDDAERIERKPDREGECQMHRQDETDLDDHIACLGRAIESKGRTFGSA
jgi:hypothetical protein